MTRLRGLGVALVVLALCAASSALVTARDRWTPVAASDRRDLYVRSGRAARALAGPLDALAADIYWLRVVQHFGGDRLNHRAARPFELLQPLLDLTTTLDPQFTAAYRFGAIFLAVTGGEALYADLGHFGRKPIQSAWICLVLPALLLNYFGQGALVLAHPEAIENPFYRLVPEALLLPMVSSTSLLPL